MASYTPPTANLPTFDPTVFRQITDALTIEDGDLRYLRFPTGQGAEYIPSLSVGGLTTLAGATYNAGTSPAYEIKYPVNSGRFDFYANTSGGVSTRGGKIDATGVHTISKFDTIDETAGSLDIGVLAARTGTIQIGGATGTGAGRTINIGTTSGSGTNTINIGGSAITVGSANTSTLTVNPDAASALRLGNNMTGGSIVMGGTTGGTTTIAIGNGTAQTGAISIGTGNTASALPITIGNITGAFGTVDIGTRDITIGKSNTVNTNIQTSTSGTLNLKTTATGGAINIGNTSGGTITINRPLLPAYTGTTPASTEIGYTVNTTNNTYVAATAAGNYEVMNVSIPNGVWLVEACLVFINATGGYRKMGLNTTSASLANNDRSAGVATGSNASLQVATVFSFASATTVYLNIDIGAALSIVSGENVFNLRRTRIA